MEELLFFGHIFGLDGHRYDRLRHIEALQQNGVVLGRQSVAGCNPLEARGGDDGPGADLFEALSPVGVHSKEPGHTLVALSGDVVNNAVGSKAARVRAQVDELAPLVHRDLERKGAERVIHRGVA